MMIFQPNQYPQLTRYLAIYHPLVLTTPDLHWLIGSSFTSPEARLLLKLCELLVLITVSTFEPSSLNMILLQQCFVFLGQPARLTHTSKRSSHEEIRGFINHQL
jgi:hypothetical protein